MSKRKTKDRPKRGRGPSQGTAVVWPRGLEERYDISAVTRWRNERKGLLPPRDVFTMGRSGWRLSTLEAFERDPKNGAAHNEERAA